MEEEVKTQFCSNCRRDIPAINYVMHASHCQRNLTLCKVCGEPVPIAQQEEHFEENHAKVKCECGESLEKMDLEGHKEKNCPKRQVSCQYCELELPFSEMASHVEYCGSRTEKCDECDRYIQKRDFDQHMGSGCRFPLKEEKQIPPNPVDDSISTMPASMLHAMGLINSSDRSPYGDFYGPPLSNMREFKRIVQTGFGTPPFSDPLDDFLGGGAAPFSADSDDHSLMNREINARGRGTTSIPSKSEYDPDTWYQVDGEEYAEHVDDDEEIAAEFQAEEIEHERKISDMSGGIIDEPFPTIHSAVIPEDTGTDETELPCEFCGGLFPMGALILHQSGCQLNSMDSFGRVAYFPLRSSPRRSLPPLNNSAIRARLHSPTFDQEDEFQRESDEETKEVMESGNDTFLPCEFCQELFPSDNLIQHQAVCDAGPASRPPSGIPDRSGPVPAQFMNNSRPARSVPNRNRPSRPVYETDDTSHSIGNHFIPGELDNSDSFHAGRGIDFDAVNGNNSAINEVTRDTGRLNNESYRRGSGDRRGQAEMMRNNDFPSSQPNKDSTRIKNGTVNQTGRRQAEATSAANKPGATQKKPNPGARMKQTADVKKSSTRVQKTAEPSDRTVTRQASLPCDFPQVPKRESNEQKTTTRTYKSEKPKSEKTRQSTDIRMGSSDSKNMRSDVSRSGTSGAAERSSRGEPATYANGTRTASNPRRNPPTKTLADLDRPPRGREGRPADISLQGNGYSSSAQPKKTFGRKKIV